MYLIIYFNNCPYSLMDRELGLSAIVRAPVVKWISRLASDQEFRVRILTGAMAMAGGSDQKRIQSKYFYVGFTRSSDRVGSRMTPQIPLGARKISNF